MNTKQLLQESERSRLALLSVLEDQKETEEKLRKSEVYNRLLFNLSPIGLALCKMDGTLVDVNPAYAKIIGRTVEETLKLTYWDITPKNYADQEKQQIISLEETGSYGPYEKEYIHKDGHLVPVQLQGLIFEQEGERFIWSSTEDISERKKSEQALRMSEARFRKLVETEPECVKVITEDSILQDMNPAGLAMIDADSREQVVGKSVLGIINPEYREAFKGLVKRVFRGESGKLEFKITGLKGTKRWLETHAVPMRDEEGKVQSLLSITRDITERKRTEESLRESVALMRTIAENYPNSYLSIVEKDLTIGFTSGQEFKKQNLNPAQFVGMTLEQAFGDQASVVREYYVNAFAGKEQSFELLVNGQYQFYRIVPLYAQDGTIPRILSVVENITERKQAELALRDSEERWKSLVQNAADTITLVDRNARILFINKVHPSVPMDKVVGARLYDFMTFENQMVAETALERAFTSGEPQTYQVVATPVEGEMYWYDNRIGPILKGDKIATAVIITTDITESKRAEEGIRESEEKYRSLIDTMQEGLGVQDKNGLITFMNKRGCEMLGYELDELLGKPTTFVFDEDNRKILREQMTKRRKGEHQSYEIAWTRKDGGKIETITAPNPRFDESGNLIESVAVFSDITERKRAEGALLKSEDRFRRLAENARDMIYRMSLPDGKYEYVSPASISLFGYSPEEFYNTPILIQQSIHPDWLKYFEQQWANLLKGELPPTYEYQIIHKSGEMRWLNQRNILVRDDVGKTIAIEGIVTDITERKRAEDSLREKTEELDRFFTTTLDLLCVADTGGYFRRLNPQWEAALGYPLTELQGRSFLDLVHPEDLEATVQAVSRLESQEPVLNLVNRYRCRDGSYRWLEWRSSPRGKLVYAAAHDITERKRAEETLLALSLRQEAILAAVPDIIMEVDDDKVYTWANQAGVEFFGEDVIGTEAAFYFEGEQDTYVTVQPLFSGAEKVIYIESWQRRKDGQKRLLAWWCRVLKDESGNVTGALSTARDITEHKRAEEALKDSESKFRTIIEASPVPYALNDEQQNITYLNKAFVKTFGYNLEDIPTLADWWPKAYPDAEYRQWVATTWQERLDTAKQKGIPFEPLELNIRCKDGTQRTAMVGASSLGQSYNGVHLVILYDITERKRAEEALRETRNYLENLLDYANAPIIVWTPAFRITRFNHAFERLTGHSSDDVIGGELGILFPAVDRDESLNKIVRTISGEYWESVEIPILCKDGETRIVLWNSANIYAEDGATLMTTIAQGQDITERKLAQENLSRHAQDLATLLKISQELAVMLDLRTILQLTTDRITELTELKSSAIYLLEGEILRLWATTPPLPPEVPEEFRNAPLADHPHIHKAISTRMPVFLPDTATADFTPAERAISEMRGLHSILYLPLITRTRVLGTLIVTTIEEPRTLSDAEINLCITLANLGALAIENAMLYEEVKKHTLQLEQIVTDRTAELRSANKELEAFSYSVSHDLRATLRAIDGFSLALLEDYSNKLDKEGRHHLQRVRNGATEMAQLIDDLLNLSRISRRELTRGTVDLSKIAKYIKEKLIASEPGRTVKFTIADDVRVQGDGNLLKIVMDNLINNAWKFTSKKKAAKIDFGVLEKEGKTVYYIKDNGVGFDMKYADKLFNPFQRLHRKEDYPGTGIGLATVRRIILKHGGSIWAESEIGKGAIFYFTL